MQVVGDGQVVDNTDCKKSIVMPVWLCGLIEENAAVNARSFSGEAVILLARCFGRDATGIVRSQHESRHSDCEGGRP